MTTNIVIVKNNTGTSTFIEDMGVAVPGSGERNFSDIFDFTEICISENLKYFVNNTTFTINNGTSDLNISDAIEYLDCKNAGGSTGASYLNDLNDVNISNPSDKYALIFDTNTNTWIDGQAGSISSNIAPDSTSDIWIDTDSTSGSIGTYTYDNEIGDWITTSSNIYLFTRDNKVDGAYIGISGHAGYYYIHQKGYITSIHCHVEKGNLTKGFQVHINGVNQYEFFLVNGTYSNSNLNLLINKDDILKLWCDHDGSPAEDTSCQLIINWSHDEV